MADQKQRFDRGFKDNMEDIDVFEKGDKVYDISYGWGEVEIVRPKEEAGSLNVFVTFASGTIRYSENGSRDSCCPSLSFGDYSVSEDFTRIRPLPKLKNSQLIYVRNEEGCNWHMRYFYGWVSGKVHCYLNQLNKGDHTSWNYYSTENPLLK